MDVSRKDLVRLTQEPERFLRSADAALRRMAVTALAPGQECAQLVALCADEDTPVRAAVAEKLGSCPAEAAAALLELRGDTEATVREAAATAYGNLGDPGPVDWLVDAASNDPDRQVQEASVAALGAIGSAAAIDPLLGLLLDGPPQVRRRAIAALTVFDDERIEPALRRAALDRNPGVREAAEMVVGRQITD